MVMDYVLKSYISAAGGTSSDARGLRERGRDLFDLLGMPPFMGGHQLDPLIHVHRPEERVIKRHLAQGQSIASGERMAKCRVVALERRPPARDIHGAGRLRRFGRLPLVHAI